ncbi:MAG TPA: hypothetical protein QF901_06320, partial [Gammaproteobacteria bacterium]|nr:hypothetical protein [Gammaproteobacteria bacterium]
QRIERRVERYLEVFVVAKRDEPVRVRPRETTDRFHMRGRPAPSGDELAVLLTLDAQAAGLDRNRVGVWGLCDVAIHFVLCRVDFV